MWYFAWILGVLLACALGIINVLWLEAQESLDQESMVLDPITKTLIRFEFLTLLEEKIAQVDTDKKAFSLLMMGIDGFSGGNASDVSDSILLEYAAIIKGVFRRNEDVLARYDARTFAAILPDTRFHDAESVAGRIYSKARESSVPRQEHSAIRIGIRECRAGHLAAFDNDAKAAMDRLLRDVDQAMKNSSPRI